MFESVSRLSWRVALALAWLCSCTSPREKRPVPTPPTGPARDSGRDISPPSEPGTASADKPATTTTTDWQPYLEVLREDGVIHTVNAPYKEPQEPFALVAMRRGPISFHFDAKSARPVLFGGQPYLFHERGVLRPLTGSLTGSLTGLPEMTFVGHETVTVSGGFTGPGDGWMVLTQWKDLDFSIDILGLPITYRWKNPGWKRRRRPVRNGYTQIERKMICGGDGPYLEVYYRNLSQKEQGSGLAPPDEIVRFGGGSANLRLSRKEYDRTFACRANGEIYGIALTKKKGKKKKGKQQDCIEHLSQWLPGKQVRQTYKLPGLDPAMDCLTPGMDGGLVAFDSGVAVWGRTKSLDRSEDLTYLAVGEPHALEVVPLELEGYPLQTAIQSVTDGQRPGELWILISGMLFYRPANGQLQNITIPDPRAQLDVLKTLDWAWDEFQGGWWSYERDRRESEKPINSIMIGDVVDVRRVGADVWLTVESWHQTFMWLTVTGVYKTGVTNGQAVELPSLVRTTGERVRLADGEWKELRLLERVSADEMATFEREHLPWLSERPEVLQIYESRDGETHSITAVTTRTLWRKTYLKEYESHLGRRPNSVPEPSSIHRMLYEKEKAHPRYRWPWHREDGYRDTCYR